MTQNAHKAVPSGF